MTVISKSQALDPVLETVDEQRQGSIRVEAPHREGAWTLLYEGGMWGSWWGKLGRVPEVTGPGQTGEREGEC